MATANMKDVKRRIKSVQSTMQITKAMELVASSKLRKAKNRAEASQPFFNLLYEAMCDISEDSTFQSRFLKKKKNNNILLIVIAGDRGLAGGYNANILKSAVARVNELKEKNIDVTILPIGKKAVEFFEKRNYKILKSYIGVAETITIYDCMDIADIIIKSYSSNETDSVEMFYTTFLSALEQVPQSVKVLPVELEPDKKAKQSLTIYEPSPMAVFDSLIPKYIAGMLYGAIVDSFASEQGSRRTAMESASDNANDMINDLSLLYNRARQSAITQEITEIVSGSQNNM